MKNGELVCIYVKIWQKIKTLMSLILYAVAFFSSTFAGRSLSIWNYELFLENTDANSLPFYNYLQVITKVF